MRLHAKKDNVQHVFYLARTLHNDLTLITSRLKRISSRKWNVSAVINSLILDGIEAYKNMTPAKADKLFARYSGDVEGEHYDNNSGNGKTIAGGGGGELQVTASADSDRG